MTSGFDMEHSTRASFRKGQAWAYLVLLFSVAVAYGGVWTRGVQGDDLCMGELANKHGYWEAVRYWLENWNSRLFLALTQVGTYHLPWFSAPLNAPWFILHATIVGAHMAFCGLLFSLLSRAGLATGASLAAGLVFAIHPITFEPVLWLAEGYGYVLGNLLAILAVWCYLEYERGSRLVWLILAILLALAATLGIEQYLFVLGGLSIVHLLRSRWHTPRYPAWLPLLIVGFCALVFLAIHFGLFSGTSDRLGRATEGSGQIAGPGIFWKLGWWLSLFPDASAYGGLYRIGLEILRGNSWLIVLLSLAVLGAVWRIAKADSWRKGDGDYLPTRHVWLTITGLAVFCAALFPFLFTGKYGFASRNIYVALPGLLIVVAVTLDLLAGWMASHRMLRFTLAPIVAACVAMSLAIDIGAQGIFAQSWWFHKQLIRTIEADAEDIRSAGALEVTGIPAMPYRSISQINNAWAFPCLVRWVVKDNKVRAWNNLMSPENRTYGFPDSHRIHWREY
jgi:hypothetical protein